MKKLNNKGFTIVELTLSFVFVFTLAFSMYQLLFNYRMKQNEESIKSQMLDYKNQVTLAIQNDINEKSLKKIDYCMNGSSVVNRCLVLYFNDGTSKQLAVEKGYTTYDGEEFEINYISYGGVIYQSSDAILLEYRANYMLYNTYESNHLENDNVKIYRISIPIYHNDLNENYGIEIVATAFNYDYEGSRDVVGDGTITSPDENLKTADGTIYNGYVTSTNRHIDSDVKNQTIIARVKFDSAKMGTFQQYFGNWQLGGGGLSLGSRSNVASNKACFGAQVSNNKLYTSTYTEVCSSTALSPNRFYIIAGTFDSAAKTMKIYVDGVESGSMTLSADSVIDKSSMSFGLGGNPGVTTSNLFYGTISNAIVYNTTLNGTVIGNCFKTAIDTGCATTNGINADAKIIDESLIYIKK